MTDRTQPDSGRATGHTHIIRYALELGLLWVDGSGRDKVREALDALDTLEAQLEAIGAGGVQALSAAPAVPAGWKAVPVNPTPEMWKAAKTVPDPNPPYPPHYGLVWDAMLAASPTPPAEQQAAPKAAPGGPSDAEIDDFLDSPACITWVIASNRDRYRLLVRAVLAKWAAPQQEAQEPAKVPYQKLTDEIDLILSDPDTELSIGAKRALLWMRTWVSVPLYTAPQQEAQEPCPTCAALARTVMLDQVSFDRKPDCYGIRQITDDEGVEEWEDIRTSPDVAREEANDMMATGRGEIYEVVPLWTTPQHAPQPAPAPLSERDAFERDWEKRHAPVPINGRTHDDGRYGDSSTQDAWESWQARAALAAQGGKDA